MVERFARGLPGFDSLPRCFPSIQQEIQMRISTNFKAWAAAVCVATAGGLVYAQSGTTTSPNAGSSNLGSATGATPGAADTNPSANSYPRDPNSNNASSTGSATGATDSLPNSSAGRNADGSMNSGNATDNGTYNADGTRAAKRDRN
jgi:hypothetical protein